MKISNLNKYFPLIAPLIPLKRGLCALQFIYLADKIECFLNFDSVTPFAILKKDWGGGFSKMILPLTKPHYLLLTKWDQMMFLWGMEF